MRHANKLKSTPLAAMKMREYPAYRRARQTFIIESPTMRVTDVFA
jgi:hypothetical protein